MGFDLSHSLLDSGFKSRFLKMMDSLLRLNLLRAIDIYRSNIIALLIKIVKMPQN